MNEAIDPKEGKKGLGAGAGAGALARLVAVLLAANVIVATT